MSNNPYRLDTALNVLTSARGGVNIDATSLTQTLICGVAGTDTATTRYFPYEKGFYAIYSVAGTLISLGAANTGRGEELITNGTFTGDTDWTKGTGWTLPGTVADSDATQVADSDLSQTVVITPGLSYEAIFTAANRTVGNVTAVVGGTEGTDRATNATFTETIIAGNTDSLFAIRADLDWDGDVDNVSLKEVVSNTMVAGVGGEPMAGLELTGTVVLGGAHTVLVVTAGLGRAYFV